MCGCNKTVTTARCKSNAYKERRVNRVLNKLNTLLVIATDPNDIEEYQQLLGTISNEEECVSNETLRLIENYVEDEYNKYSEL